ncbi:MAG: putative dTDP-4-dehydrorhamnose reductase [Verrucomicrobiales bacterium]|nr:putative dTDP-4-dehydrorhamnose reductase [Verrucomicrobiales bacterium]
MATPISVWVTGEGGFVGNAIVRSARDSNVISLTRREIDLTDFHAVSARFRQDKPDFIIHTAAMARSPDCQANPTLSRKINVAATAHLAGLAQNIGFIFFSTDLVFDGKKGNYVETDEPNPLSVYAETKVAAEQIILRNPQHTVVRCSLVFGASPKGNHSFNEDLRAAWNAGKTTKLFHDEYRTPIHVDLVARAIWEIVAQKHSGLFHLAGAEKFSRLQLGELVAARYPELTPRIESCSLREYQGPPRPRDASLNCAKLQSLVSFKLAGLNEWLEQHPDAGF